MLWGEAAVNVSAATCASFNRWGVAVQQHCRTCSPSLAPVAWPDPAAGGALPSLPSTPAASQPLSLVSGTIPEEGEEEEEPSVQPSSVAAEAAAAAEDATEAPEASGASGTAAEAAAAGAAVAEASGSRGLSEGEGAPGSAGSAADAVTPPRAQHMLPGPGVGVSPRKNAPIWGASEVSPGWGSGMCMNGGGVAGVGERCTRCS